MHLPLIGGSGGGILLQVLQQLVVLNSGIFPTAHTGRLAKFAAHASKVAIEQVDTVGLQDIQQSVVRIGNTVPQTERVGIKLRQFWTVVPLQYGVEIWPLSGLHEGQPVARIDGTCPLVQTGIVSGFVRHGRTGGIMLFGEQL